MQSMNMSLPLFMRPFLNEMVAKVKLTQLCSLIHDNKLRDVEFFLRNGHDVNEKLEDGRTALHLAVEFGNTSMVALLIHHGADVNMRDQNGLTALHIACFYLHKDIVQLLLDAKADIHAHSMMGSPILAATIWGHPTKITDPCDVLSILIEYGANVNDKINDTDGMSPLAIAVNDNNVNLLNKLIAANVDVNVRAGTLNEGKKPLLSIAVRKGYIEIVKAFLKAKSLNVTVSDENLNTALHESCLLGSLQMVKLLVKGNFDLNRLNIDHETPLHLALATYNFAIAEYLVHHEGINVNLPSTEFKDLPLHFAIIHFANALASSLLSNEAFSKLKENVIQTIIDKMQYLNAGSSKKLTPLEIAVYHRDISTCKYLIKKGANVNASDFQNRMNLMKSIIYIDERQEVARLYPPLKIACTQKDNIDMVRLLLSNGAEVNDGPKLYRALTIAIETGGFEIVKELQNFGAQIDKETLDESQSVYRTSASFRELDERKKINDLLKLNLKFMENVRMNNIEEVKKNIKDGACVNVSQAPTGESSLIYASWKGHETLVDLLLENGAEVNFIGAKGLRSLHMACKFNPNSNIIRKLLLHGAFYNVKDLNQGTPLVYARNKEDAFKLLSTIHFLFENVRLKKLNDVIEVLSKMKDDEEDKFNIMKCVKNKAGQTLIQMVQHLYGKNTDYTEIVEKLQTVLNTNPA